MTQLSPQSRNLKNNDIRFADGRINLYGAEFELPADLSIFIAAIGEPDRFVDARNHIYTWDALGVTVFSTAKTQRIDTVEVFFTSDEYDYSPHEGFTGKLWLGGGSIESHADEQMLLSAGLQQDPELPFLYVAEDAGFQIIAELPDTLRSVSIGQKELGFFGRLFNWLFGWI